MRRVFLEEKAAFVKAVGEKKEPFKKLQEIQNGEARIRHEGEWGPNPAGEREAGNSIKVLRLCLLFRPWGALEDFKQRLCFTCQGGTCALSHN